MAFLDEKQWDAVKRMKNGCILCGGTGSGKSRTGLAYYFLRQGGDPQRITILEKRKPLYIITTARKRDTFEWEKELAPFHFDAEVIDSWNNIEKYKNVENAFFIFDEQRVIGYGVWSHAFIKIARHNEWILMSATPGDTWMDYLSVFIANGYYRNKGDFTDNHVLYGRQKMGSRSFEVVRGYMNEGRLLRIRNDILIIMDYESKFKIHQEYVDCNYSLADYRLVMKTRANPETGEPFIDSSGVCQYLRKIVNSDSDRINKTKSLAEKHNKVIIFYSYDYELDILRNLFKDTDFEVAEWNGHKHMLVPESNKWVYLVNYTGGSEAWNCITTNTIIFYSLPYSYRTMVQASGRIARRNSPYTDLYYYWLRSKAPIDLSILASLREKKTFNEKAFLYNSR